MNAISNERKQQEDREDEKKAELLKWCIRVRSLVLVPSVMQRADASLPSSDGALSPPMVEVLNDATVLGIRDLPVVVEVENALKCIAWCCYAMPLLTRRPSLKEITSIISKGTALNLPEERPMRMMKSMASRAKTWQNKVVKALAFKPHVTDPVNVDTLKGLVQAATDIPLDDSRRELRSKCTRRQRNSILCLRRTAFRLVYARLRQMRTMVPRSMCSSEE